MTAWTVFVRTLLRTSAIFVGTTFVFLHPPLEWSSRVAVSAQKSSVESAIDGLIVALRDPDEGVRAQAAAALGRIGNPRAVPALLNSITDTVEVRRCVVKALGQIGDRAALPALVAALKDDDARVRRYAGRAIAAIGG